MYVNTKITEETARNQINIYNNDCNLRQKEAKKIKLKLKLK